MPERYYKPLRVDEVTEGTLQSFAGSLIVEGMAFDKVRAMLTTLRAALKWSCDAGIVQSAAAAA